MLFTYNTGARHAPGQRWARISALALDSVSSVHSRRAYATSLDDFQRWCGANDADGFTKATVQRYRAALEARGLAPPLPSIDEDGRLGLKYILHWSHW